MPDVVDLRNPGRRGEQRNSIGMVLFLVSWGVTFVFLFLAYGLVRVRQAEWPPAGTPALGLAAPVANTLVAFASSVAFEVGLRAVQAGHLRRFRWAVLVAAALAIAFLGVQFALWERLSSQGLNAGDSVFAGMFYMLTWFHAAHVVVALCVVGWLAPGIVRERYNAREHQAVRYATWFWHFVTVAWVGVVVSIWVV